MSLIAGAPISWGVCEVPGWGYQLPPDRVLREMREVGLAATELGPDGFLPGDPGALLSRYGLRPVGGFTPLVLHVPGHAPGHVAFVRQGSMLGGDLLFAGSIGRTDLPLSNPDQMTESLERAAALPEETIVYPGHGPTTSIGQERATNPFLTGLARVVRR